jgi:hypothetical protein
MKNFFLWVIILFLNTSIFSQESYWVNAQLPGPLPLLYEYSVGETCIIFADDTSQAVYAFDINYGDWQVLLVPTELDWIDAAADGNAAMIYNDSIVVGYSAITNSFATLAYTGTLITLSGDTYGCIDNFAFFVTDQLFYIFDVEDAQWYSFSYTPPGSAPWVGGVSGKEDYIYLNLSINNQPPVTLTAYSLHTKTFDQFASDYLYQPSNLDHGFTFSNTNEAPYLCLGYSAYTGQFKYKTHSRYISGNGPNVGDEIVSPFVCALFVTNEQINGNIYQYYMWVFNTVVGDFAEYTFEYTYNGSNYVPEGSVCGGQTAYVIIRNVDASDKLELVVYSAETNSFTHFDTPLYYWSFMSFNAGGLIIHGFDEHNYFLYDVHTQTSFNHPVQWTQGFQPGVKANAPANDWSVFAYSKQNEDTVHVFSYNRPDASLYNFDIAGRASLSSYRGGDLYGLLVTDNLGVLTNAFLYSPLYNIWTEKDYASTSYGGSEGNYFYLNYTNSNQTYFYDAQTNQEYWFPSAQQAQDVYARDSVFFMYSNDGKYIGYSMNEHASSEYTVNKFAGRQWANYIILNHNAGSSSALYDHLLYDGYNNIFAPLTLTPEQGIRKTSWAGGKTAFIASQNGYLFAYSPNDPNDVDDDLNFKEQITYSLYQNYPNPFNPSTTISWQIPKAGFVTLKIYDVLGREVLTLVNEEQSASKHDVTLDATKFSSGVYFYQLTTGNFISTKKMMLIK